MVEYVPTSFSSAFANGGGNLAAFLYVGTSPAPLRLCVGSDEIPFQTTTLDDQDYPYKGCGSLLGIPDFEVLMNGIADVVNLSMSGITPEVLARIATDASPVLGAEARITIGLLDERFQLISSNLPIWSGTADLWWERLEPRRGPKDPRLYTVGLTLQSGDSSRAFSSMSMFTDQAQQTASPGDRFCERTSRYIVGVGVAWP